MQTKIKTTVYAAKLRAKVKELEAKRKTDLETYKKEFEKWRVALAKWIVTEGAARAGRITTKEVRENTNRFHHSVPFSTSKIFDGCPQPPEHPSDKQIREIKALLRHLGITGQAFVTVSTADVERHLGDGGKYDED